MGSDRGDLLVIDDEDGPRILREIDSRRVDYLRREYDFLPQDESPEQHRKRFRWLHREGALSDEELRQRMATVDALDQMPAMAAPDVPMRLN